MTELASLVTGYARQRDLGTVADRAGVHVFALDAGADGHHMVASVRRVGPDGTFVVVQVRSRQRVVPENWPDAVASCNLWNTRMRVPKAWLDADTLDAGASQVDAGVVLEACVPATAVTPESFSLLVDGTCVGARQFWRWVDVHARW